MVQIWHWLYLACLPAAIILLLARQWLAAAIVFLVAVPVFWALRNRAAGAQMTADPLSRQLKGAPARFTIPPDVDARLSAKNLQDVPERVRVGSPHDVSDAAVRDTLRKLGVMHPGTNYGVVYRSCFAPFLEDGERPQFIRFAWASLRVAPPGNPPKHDDPEQAWALVTDHGVYWHQVSDRVPGMPARDYYETMMAPKRWFTFGSGVKAAATEQHAGPGGIPMRTLTIENTDETSVWRVTLSMAIDPQTDALIRYVEEHAKGA